MWNETFWKDNLGVYSIRTDKAEYNKVEHNMVEMYKQT